MAQADLDTKLEKLEKPHVALPQYNKQLRLTFLNAKKSAWWSLILIFLPVVFVVYNVLKYVIGLAFLPELGTLVPSGVGNVIFSPFIFIGGGISAVVLNLLAILHFEFNSEQHTWNFILSIKKKKWNLIILTIAVVAMIILFTYVLAENWQCIVGLQQTC